jgi:hypothetical protein
MEISMHAFIPGVGIGPVRFGSSLAEIVSVLGPPSSEGKREIRPFHSADAKKFLKRIDCASFERSQVEDLRPDVEFLDGKLASIHIYHKGDHVSFMDMDILAENRKSFLAKVYSLYSHAFATKEAFYFNDIELYVSRAKYIKQYNYFGCSYMKYFEMQPNYIIYKRFDGPSAE